MFRTALIACCLLTTLASLALAQGTYGPGHLPNRPPRLSEKSRTTAIVLEVYTDNDLLKVKDEITNEQSVYRVGSSVEIVGDKKEFGSKRLTLKDIPKGRRVKVTYFKQAPNVAQEIEILKPKKD